MLSYFSILSLALALVQGLSIVPENKAGVATTDGPAPLKFDFDILDTVGNLTAKEYWAKVNLLRRQNQKRDSYPISILNYRDLSYNLNITLGSDEQQVLVSLDTASADLWVTNTDTGDGSYDPLTSTTSQNINEEFFIKYGDGTSSQGDYYLDTSAFPSSSLVVNNFQFAYVSQGDTGVAGILGVADRNGEATSNQYDNLPWALANANITPKASYSLYVGSEKEKRGSIIFGGIDTEKYSGTLTKYPVDTRKGSFLSVNVPSVDVDGHLIEINQPFVLDSGTALGWVPKNFQDYLDSIFDTTPEVDGDITYRYVSCDQPTDKFITFNFGCNTIKLSYADAIASNNDGTCLLGFTYNDDDLYVLGDVFLRSAYVYYDLTDKSISLAQAAYSDSSNIISA